MTKQEFLTSLRVELAGLPPSEVEEILRDQEEFIRDATASGRSEAEALSSLGTPKMFAASLLAESRVQKAETATGMRSRLGNTWLAVLGMGAVLAPLNFFILLGPFIAAAAFLMSGWIVAAILLLISFGNFFLFFFEVVFVPVGAWVHLSMFFFTIGLVGMALFATLVTFMLTKLLIDTTIRYLKWNLSLISSQARSLS